MLRSAIILRPMYEEMPLMRKFLERATGIGTWIAAGSLFTLTLLIVIGIVFRFVFSHSLPWAIELSQFLLMWMVYLGTAAVSLKCDHISADIIGPLLPERGRQVRNLVSEIIITAMLAILVIILVPYTVRLSSTRNASTVLRMPQFVMFITYIVGLALMDLTHLWNIIRRIGELKAGHIDENKEKVR